MGFKKTKTNKKTNKKKHSTTHNSILRNLLWALQGGYNHCCLEISQYMTRYHRHIYDGSDEGGVLQDGPRAL